MKFLVTGARSGLGRYLAEDFDAVAVSRERPLESVAGSIAAPLDAIIHCAANGTRDVEASDLAAYLDDNLFLAEKLMRIPHKVFVFVSTIAVYPPVDAVHSEKEKLWVGNLQYVYPITKLMSEAIIRKRCPRHIILRPTAMLGKYSRPNSLIRILTEDDCQLTITGDSAFNYILHRDIADFTRACLEQRITGTFNLASEGRVRLEETARRYRRRVKFGSYRYEIGTIDNSEAKKILPAFAKKSVDVVDSFARDHLGLTPKA